MCPKPPLRTKASYLALKLGLAQLNVLHFSLEAGLPLYFLFRLEGEGGERAGRGRRSELQQHAITVGGCVCVCARPFPHVAVVGEPRRMDIALCRPV